MLAQKAGGPLELAAATDRDELFDHLYREHYPDLVSFFGRRGLDAEISRELAQDTMLRAYGGLGEIEDWTRHRSWILTIAVNTWKNWLRDHRGTAKRRERESSLEEARAAGLQVAEDSGLWPRRSSDPERRAVEREAREWVRSRIPALSARQRECLLLWLDGWSYQEISDQLGASLQTVRTSLHKAKARIETELQPAFRGARPPAGEAS